MMKAQYKSIRENANVIHAGGYNPVVLNAWNINDAEKIKEAFHASGAKCLIGDKHFLIADYGNDTVFGSKMLTNTAGALKGLISNAIHNSDYDHELYFRSITDCTANISVNGVMISAPSTMNLDDISTFESLIYNGHAIDAIAVAESIDVFKMAARFGEVRDYDESKTYIIVTPQALEDANQAERFKIIEQDLPVVYDQRNHKGFKAALLAA